MSSTRAPGRRPATDHAAIEAAAFELFAERGFDKTTMDAIAEAVGVGRRTLFRYFPSKNDIPWGRFDESLTAFAAHLDTADRDAPVLQTLHRCIVDFNSFEPEALAQHRFRMHLILSTPTLQAHSAVMYAAWRRVIASHVAERRGERAGDPVPRMAGHVSLALALSAYEQWLEDPDLDLTDLMRRSLPQLRALLE